MVSMLRLLKVNLSQSCFLIKAGSKFMNFFFFMYLVFSLHCACKSKQDFPGGKWVKCRSIFSTGSVRIMKVHLTCRVFISGWKWKKSDDFVKDFYEMTCNITTALLYQIQWTVESPNSKLCISNYLAIHTKQLLLCLLLNNSIL